VIYLSFESISFADFHQAKVLALCKQNSDHIFYETFLVQILISNYTQNINLWHVLKHINFNK